MFGWFRSKHNERFDATWSEVLRENVWHYRYLDVSGRDRVHEVVMRLVNRKDWVGAGGLAMTDEVRVTISGVAALLTLGLDEPYDFPRLKSVIVYPASFQSPEQTTSFTLLGDEDPFSQIGPRHGEAWPRSPIVLSWRSALRQARVRGRGQNLVLHEFAHHVDGLNGDMDGVPHFDSRKKTREWARVADAEYRRLVGRASRRESSLIDTYGATNKAEFFAVATECFFERPHAMRAEHAELFGLMREVFQHDPASWIPTEGTLPSDR